MRMISRFHPEEMEPENFNSAKAIYEMIQRLEEE